MVPIRIIPRLEIKNGILIKGINFEGLRVLGDPAKFVENYFNSGVLLLDRNTILKMKPFLSHEQIEEWLTARGLWSDDQSAINIAAVESGVNIVPMHQYWNQMDKRYKDGYIVHLKGSIKNRSNVFDDRAKEYLNAVSSSN